MEFTDIYQLINGLSKAGSSFREGEDVFMAHRYFKERVSIDLLTLGGGGGILVKKVFSRRTRAVPVCSTCP